MSFSTSIGSVLVIGLMFLLVTAIVKTGQDLMETEKKKQGLSKKLKRKYGISEGKNATQKRKKDGKR